MSITNQWKGDAPAIAQVNTITPGSVTVGNTFTLRIGDTLQVETATIVGTITGNGNATITVTAAGMSNSPKAVSVAVLNGDTASVVGGKVRTALAADVDVSAFFTVSGSGANVVLTVITPAANDATINIASANGTCTGLTAQPTSVHTTAGFLGRSVTFTATVATVANVTAGLVAAIAAANILEFNELSAVDNTTNLTLTASNAGKPFSQTSSAATGSGTPGATLVTSITTASSGPNDYAITSNWTQGAIPTSTHDVLYDNSSVDCLYNLPAAAVTVNSFKRTGTYTGAIGLAQYDDNGYLQYRQRFLKMNCATFELGTVGLSGPGRELYDLTNNVVTFNVWSCGSPTDTNQPALHVINTAASSVLNVIQGVVGIASTPGEAATITTLRVGNDGNVASDVTVFVGSGATLTTTNQYGGTLNTLASITTANVQAGTLSLQGAAAVTTLNATGGSTVDYLSNGTIGTFNLSGSTLDNTQDQRAKTITALNIKAAGYNYQDPGGKITLSAGPVFSTGLGLQDGTFNPGLGRTITVT